MDVIYIGRVIRPHGLKGKVIVRTFAEFPRNVKPFSSICVGTCSADSYTIIIDSLVPSARKNEFIVTFQGIDNRTQADTIIGSLLWLPQEELEALPENEYYIFELIGCRIYTVSGENAGIVEDVVSIPGNDLLHVNDGVNSYFIPMVKEIVKSVDIEHQRIVVELLEGLKEI